MCTVSVSGDFLNAARSFLKRVLEGFLKFVSVLKEASKNLAFDFLIGIKTKK
jgi:hypothetical protein